MRTLILTLTLTLTLTHYPSPVRTLALTLTLTLNQGVAEVPPAGMNEAAPRAFAASVPLARLLRVRFWRVRVELRTPQVLLVGLGLGI